MESKVINFSRRELYEQVWSTPDEWVGGRGTQQKNWRDTKSAVLEDRLPKFMSGLI